jgi:hypothetical protein
VDINPANAERLLPDIAAALRAHGCAIVASIESVDIWRKQLDAPVEFSVGASPPG